MPEPDQTPDPQPAPAGVEANLSVPVVHPEWPKKVNIADEVEDLKLITILLDLGPVHPTGG